MEVLSPVGSFAALSAALQANADAVYFGLGELNMRAKAAVNFSVNDLPEIMSQCRKQDVKAYLALNTVVFDGELADITNILDEAVRHKVDAIIASDIAVITEARKRGLAVHLSTQCNVTNIEAVKFYAQFADVIVLAREVSLEQIANITSRIKQENICGASGFPIKIEIFAHGAFCMATSGKCYLSLDNFNKSANRGSCLQLCRRPYLLSEIDGDVQIEVDREYLMSPKDLKTIDFLDKIAQAGVSVLKIEGRGRSADYVKTVTRVYKEAVQALAKSAKSTESASGTKGAGGSDDAKEAKGADSAEGGYNKERIEQWNKELASVYNRGFWSGYYLGKNIGEWTQHYGSKASTQKTYIGKITNYFTNIGVAEVRIEAGVLHKGDKYLVIGNTTGVYEDVLSEVRLDLTPVDMVKQGDLCSIPTKELLRRGDKLYLVEDL